jgi:hypothetical protein
MPSDVDNTASDEPTSDSLRSDSNNDSFRSDSSGLAASTRTRSASSRSIDVMLNAYDDDDNNNDNNNDDSGSSGVVVGAIDDGDEEASDPADNVVLGGGNAARVANVGGGIDVLSLLGSSITGILLFVRFVFALRCCL